MATFWSITPAATLAWWSPAVGGRKTVASGGSKVADGFLVFNSRKNAWWWILPPQKAAPLPTLSSSRFRQQLRHPWAFRRHPFLVFSSLRLYLSHAPLLLCRVGLPSRTQSCWSSSVTAVIEEVVVIERRAMAVADGSNRSSGCKDGGRCRSSPPTAVVWRPPASLLQRKRSPDFAPHHSRKSFTRPLALLFRSLISILQQ